MALITTASPSTTNGDYGASPLKVTCSDCGTPIMEIRNGSIVISTHHHGRKHVSAVSIENLFAYWYKNAPSVGSRRPRAVLKYYT